MWDLASSLWRQKRRLHTNAHELRTKPPYLTPNLFFLLICKHNLKDRIWWRWYGHMWLKFCHFLYRCTIQKECTQALLARSWISMGEGPQQCPSITLTPPEISISADIKVELTVFVLFLLSHPSYKGISAMGSVYLKLISHALLKPDTHYYSCTACYYYCR